MSVVVVIPGEPVAKGRPRFGGQHAFTPKKTRDAEAVAAQYMRIACPEPLEGPLAVRITFTFQHPKSWSKKRIAAMSDIAPEWHTGRPDLDNTTKMILDSGIGILFGDDAKVVVIHADKVYGTEAMTKIEVWELQ